MAEAKFRFDGGGSKQADTGLEDLFGRSFAIEDERPAPVSANEDENGRDVLRSGSAGIPLPTTMLAIACLVGVSYLALWGYQQIAQSRTDIEVGF